jgi:hypothetical protein
MKETKLKKTLRLFNYWSGRLGLPKPVETRRDNRMDTHLAIDDSDKNKVYLIYNSRRLSYKPDFILINDIFHELGHILRGHKVPYEKTEDIIKAEREAERFALKCVKKYYPKKYKQLCAYYKEKKSLLKLKKKDVNYYEAFKNLKEYKL